MNFRFFFAMTFFIPILHRLGEQCAPQNWNFCVLLHYYVTISESWGSNCFPCSPGCGHCPDVFFPKSYFECEITNLAKFLWFNCNWRHRQIAFVEIILPSRVENAWRTIHFMTFYKLQTTSFYSWTSWKICKVCNIKLQWFATKEKAFNFCSRHNFTLFIAKCKINVSSIWFELGHADLFQCLKFIFSVCKFYYQHFWALLYPRGSLLLKKTAAVYMFSLYPLSSLRGKKENSESLRRE